jgi:hypothetical protein
MSVHRIKIKRQTVSQLLRHLDNGKFAVPKLQREFVWDGPKAAKLLDSIVAEMPVGVVMVWETPKSQRLFLRQAYHVLPAFKPRNRKVWFLIDGQQRVSVLHHSKEGSCVKNASGNEIDFGRVVFALDPSDEGPRIRYRKPIEGQYESIRHVLHPQWRSRLSHLGSRQRRRVEECRDKILSYPIHMMFVDGKLDQIRESFLRINTQGMKITTADAIFTRAEELELRDIRHDVRQQIDESFGRLDEMPILFAMAAIHGGTEARGDALKKALERLGEEAQQNPRRRKRLAKAWYRLAVCFGKAVDYLRQHFHVINQDYLYSDYVVAMLAVFFYWNHKGLPTSTKEQIRKWFWATTVGSRYTGRNFLRCLPEDLKFFERLAEKGSARFTYRPEVERVDVRKAQFAARTGITTAFYAMMIKRGPVGILDAGLNEIPTGRYASSANRKDRHHIFPRAPLSNLGVPPSLYNSICNICLLTAEENQRIGSRSPRQYLGDARESGTYFDRKASRHLIPVHDESGIWLRSMKKGYREFLKERMDVICDALESEAGIRLFRDA